MSSVSVENLLSTWTVFCKANLITETPYIFLFEMSKKYDTDS